MSCANSHLGPAYTNKGLRISDRDQCPAISLTLMFSIDSCWLDHVSLQKPVFSLHMMMLLALTIRQCCSSWQHSPRHVDRVVIHPSSPGVVPWKRRRALCQMGVSIAVSLSEVLQAPSRLRLSSIEMEYIRSAPHVCNTMLSP